MLQQLLFFVLLSLTFSPSTYATDGLTIREAINKSARQEALSQRIAKVYLALNNNKLEPKFYQERDAAIELFQNQLDELKWYAPTDKIKTSIKEVRKIWKEYKAIADWAINNEGCETLLKMSNVMLLTSHGLLLAYEDYAKELDKKQFNGAMFTIIKLMEETGKQRMLTQRIMLYYLAVNQGIEANPTKRKLSAAIKNYAETLTIIETAGVNSQLINAEVRTMKEDWAILNNLLQSFNNDDAGIKKMMTLADKLSTNADRIALLYEDLGIKLSISKSINVAAYQNMLTQRIAKSYVAITYGYSIAKYKRELLTCIDLFEEQMKSMTRSASTEDIKRAVGVVKIMWKNYRKLAVSWENMDELSVGKVLEKGHIMMASCDRVAQEIEVYAQTIPEYKAFFVKENGDAVDEKNNIAHQIRLAGLQRMYSQRIVIYFTMNALQVDARLSDERMKNCISKYNENFEQMISSEINNPDIVQSLNEVQNEWKIIEGHCSNLKKDDVAIVLGQSSTLFEKLDALNQLYEKHMDSLFKN
jgi:hypothetical protein